MSRYRFGIFDYDSITTNLCREGSPIRLQAQPAQVLKILLEHAGEIVTRETLQQQVWADGTQVDFERGLNYCIAQVRSALGDSADSPRFVRTIPKQGYQFIAPVTRTGSAENRPTAPPSKIRRFALLLALLALAGAALALYLTTNLKSHRPIVAVCLFDNETGELDYDRIASEFSDAVTAQLAGSQNLQVIGNADMLRKSRPARNMSQIHLVLGAEYVIIGQIQKDSTEVRVLAHLLKMPKQTHLTIERLDTPRLDDPLKTANEFAQRAAKRFLSAIDNDSSATPAR